MNGDFYKREIVITADGSSSIFLPEFNEHYHSHHGAVQESKHVFMKMGWEEAIKGKTQINILEVGFGTGLNAWLVYGQVKKGGTPIVHYTSLEAYPISQSYASGLNYATREETADFIRLHNENDWNKPVQMHSGFTLEKLSIKLADFSTNRKFDLVFFDAFAPTVQPEMWTKEVFDQLWACMNKGGILVTYCSKGEVRRNMIAAGFRAEKVAGPPGKREMLRCSRF